MAHSVESRVPFLNVELVNFVLSLPENFIVSNKGISKSIFREAMRGIVPEEILSRKDKLGFVATASNLNHLKEIRCLNNFDEKDERFSLFKKNIKKEFLSGFSKENGFKDIYWRIFNYLTWLECDDL